jgi:hypothetical protein
MSTDLETRLTTLEARVDALEGGGQSNRGRQRMPILVSVEGICGVAPDIDAVKCPFASLYRRQQGCLGTACKQKSSEYYAAYRAERAKGKKRSSAIKRKR